MTDEELLLKDLCARLPYGVKCADFRYDEDGNRIDTIDILEAIFPNRQTYKYEGILSTHHISRIKPYLRPMSSMTEEEREEYKKIAPGIVFTDGINLPHTPHVDWLNKKMFDYRGLIPMGLALEAPEGMYK